MEGEAGPTETFETHPHLALRLLTLFCIIRSGSGLSRQQWVLIRTADGTVIASNYTWNNAAVTLTADFSKILMTTSVIPRPPGGILTPTALCRKRMTDSPSGREVVGGAIRHK